MKFPRSNLVLQIRQQKHQSNVRNLFKVNNKDTSTTSKRHFGVFIVSFEQIFHIVLVFTLLVLTSKYRLDFHDNSTIKESLVT